MVEVKTKHHQITKNLLSHRATVMLKPYSVKYLTIICIALAISQPNSSRVFGGNRDVVGATRDPDLQRVTAMLEERVRQLEGRQAHKETIRFEEMFSARLALAHTLTWKSNDVERGLAEYRKIEAFRKADPGKNRIPPVELLFIAEIHKMKQEYSRAEEYYKKMIDQMAMASEQQSDDIEIIMTDELTTWTKYQLDDIRIKQNTRKKPALLLGRWKLSTSAAQVVSQLLLLFLLPDAQIALNSAQRTDLVGFIENNPKNIYFQILGAALIMNAAASYVDESAERAMRTYTARYPEAYHAILLRYLFYKFYKNNGEQEKALRMKSEIEAVERRRYVKLLIAPDERISSPEKTWVTYKQAVMDADFETMKDCYVMGSWKNIKAFQTLGKERMQKIGSAMGDLRKVTISENHAKYMLIRREHEQDIAYEVRFENLDGEWKMRDF